MGKVLIIKNANFYENRIAEIDPTGNYDLSVTTFDGTDSVITGYDLFNYSGNWIMKVVYVLSSGSGYPVSFGGNVNNTFVGIGFRPSAHLIFVMEGTTVTTELRVQSIGTMYFKKENNIIYACETNGTPSDWAVCATIDSTQSPTQDGKLTFGNWTSPFAAQENAFIGTVRASVHFNTVEPNFDF